MDKISKELILAHMHELQFIEVAATDIIQMESVKMSSPACATQLKLFQESLRQTLGLAAVPGWAAMITMQWNMAFNNAAIDFWGPNFVNQLSKASQVERIQFEHKCQVLMKEYVDQNSPLLHEHLEVNTRQLENLAVRCGDYVHSMFHNILKMTVVQAWVVMEVLFEDLLSSVAEEHENKFRHVDKTKFYFRKLDDGTRKWYNRSFRSSTIDSILCDYSLDGLAQVRHVCIHKGGVADEDFMKAVRRFPSLSAFGSLKAGDTILLNGALVRALIEPAVSQGYLLLKAVDEWLLNAHLHSIAQVSDDLA